MFKIQREPTNAPDTAVGYMEIISCRVFFEGMDRPMAEGQMIFRPGLFEEAS